MSGLAPTVREVTLILLTVGLTACVGSPPVSDGGASDARVDAPTSAACNGPPPAFEDCTGGAYHLDCGGEGGPTLGCFQHCFWFATACMPAGFVPSDCPATDLCCHPSGSGTWAYAESWVPEFYGAIVVEEVAALRGVAVTATSPATITVVIDSSVAAPTAASVSCDPGIALEFCDATPNTDWIRDAFAIFANPTRVNRQHTTIEVVPTSASTAIARMFVVLEPDTDLPASDLPARCEAAHGPRQPVVSGTVTLSSLSRSAPIHGHAELEVDGLPAMLLF